jgi:hypothetical protein
VTWPHGDPNAVAARVLSDPAYRHAKATTAAAPAESPFLTILRWIWHHVIAPLLHPLAHAVAATRGVGTVAGTIMVVAALLGLAFVIFRLVLSLVRVPGPGGAGGRAAAVRGLDVERSAFDWRRVARGDYARAIAALFSAALVELDERAVVAFDATRTPGEYRRLVRRARAAAAPAFDELTERFNHALYAAGTPVAAEYAAAERALAAFAPALSA